MAGDFARVVLQGRAVGLAYYGEKLVKRVKSVYGDGFAA